jgi:hypothetical protein
VFCSIALISTDAPGKELEKGGDEYMATHFRGLVCGDAEYTACTLLRPSDEDKLLDAGELSGEAKTSLDMAELLVFFKDVSSTKLFECFIPTAEQSRRVG